MPTDLTERLAAKLHPWLTHFTGGRYVREALVPDLLPLLLSEPELVAGLPEATKAALLRTLLEWDAERRHQGNVEKVRAALRAELEGEG